MKPLFSKLRQAQQKSTYKLFILRVFGESARVTFCKKGLSHKSIFWGERKRQKKKTV